jgi:hypothetical protein
MDFYSGDLEYGYWSIYVWGVCLLGPGLSMEKDAQDQIKPRCLTYDMNCGETKLPERGVEGHFCIENLSGEGG